MLRVDNEAAIFWRKVGYYLRYVVAGIFVSGIIYGGYALYGQQSGAVSPVLHMHETNIVLKNNFQNIYNAKNVELMSLNDEATQLVKTKSDSVSAKPVKFRTLETFDIPTIDGVESFEVKVKMVEDESLPNLKPKSRPNVSRLNIKKYVRTFNVREISGYQIRNVYQRSIVVPLEYDDMCRPVGVEEFELEIQTFNHKTPSNVHIIHLTSHRADSFGRLSFDQVPYHFPLLREGKYSSCDILYFAHWLKQMKGVKDVLLKGQGYGSYLAQKVLSLDDSPFKRILLGNVFDSSQDLAYNSMTAINVLHKYADDCSKSHDCLIKNAKLILKEALEDPKFDWGILLLHFNGFNAYDAGKMMRKDGYDVNAIKFYVFFLYYMSIKSPFSPATKSIQKLKDIHANRIAQMRNEQKDNLWVYPTFAVHPRELKSEEPKKVGKFGSYNVDDYKQDKKFQKFSQFLFEPVMYAGQKPVLMVNGLFDIENPYPNSINAYNNLINSDIVLLTNSDSDLSSSECMDQIHLNFLNNDKFSDDVKNCVSMENKRRINWNSKEMEKEMALIIEFLKSRDFE
ncbi:hypothetical protein ROZALSC1DRAFT_29372 [Rozella allomycis CSF55]|uniref:Uncharacterized protein n=1 Tax=Rozella allomycis (strain CSF55) TaxID=988480 RepID=A0A075ANV6_ROZAC|nr:hypothetical protein O9G_000116 [Rozella allomycis CSF55]RKP18988.1 hypothetical protein ROZALSC1DRAFT_29372 [Rozella allomycis CSF55]|eukprot:EPZ31637.1 hypothetical protein O9G_000116 [Rozella allomycis CSF55]